MKYLCLIYENERAWATMPKDEGDRILGEYSAFTNDIQKSGQMLAGNGLQLGGFYLIEAKDLNEAIQVAARIPAARTGSIEVRPIQTYT
jgi:hypothetical protein